LEEFMALAREAWDILVAAEEEVVLAVMDLVMMMVLLVVRVAMGSWNLPGRSKNK
jgi:hypothetical protein